MKTFARVVLLSSSSYFVVKRKLLSILYLQFSFFLPASDTNTILCNGACFRNSCVNAFSCHWNHSSLIDNRTPSLCVPAAKSAGKCVRGEKTVHDLLLATECVSWQTSLSLWWASGRRECHSCGHPSASSHMTAATSGLHSLPLRG